MVNRFLLLFTLFLTFSLLVGCNTFSKSEANNEDNSSSEAHSLNETAKKGSEPKVSSTFIAGNYKMIGEKNRIGFIYDEDIGFKPHQVNKYMWHFWGEQEELEGALKVIGKNTNTGEEITVFENMALGEPLNDADAHVPSLMSLPSSGIWELNAYIGDELFGTVVVECS